MRAPLLTWATCAAALALPFEARAQTAAPAAPTASTTSAASTPSTPPAPEKVEEVTVHGVRGEPARQELTRAEVGQIPGAFGDAFRAIEAMPGVTPLVSGLPYFLVRGAPPGNTGFFIDGVHVPALFHLGVGAAIVHPGLIDRVDFFPGGYPARFGRFTGGILSGELSPEAQKPHAEASVRLLDAGGLVDVPFANGRGEVEASGRYGYPGPLLSIFAPTVGLAYWDYQTRARWRLNDRDQISAFIFGSYDSLSSQDSTTHKWQELLGIQFHRVDLRWDRKTSATGALRVALTLGYDRSAAGSGNSTTTTVGPDGMPVQASSGPSEYSIESETVGLRAEWLDALTPEIDARVGSDVIVEPYHVVAPGSGGPVNSGTASQAFGSSQGAFNQIDVNGGIYGELSWRPVPDLELRPGLRLDAFTSRSPGGAALLGGDSGSGLAAGGVDPRLSSRWDLTSWLAWVSTMGVVHQASNIPLPSPGLQFSQLARGLQSSFQYSTGAEVQLPLKFTAMIDGFLQDYTGIADLYESCPGSQTSCTFNGRGVGLELLVRRRLTERFTGWLSYTLSETDRDAFYANHWTRRPSEFDRPHVVNLVLAADLGKRWRAGARLMAYSGLPYSTTTGVVGLPNAREPPFVRLDLRLEKKWQAMGGTLTLVFEWLNSLLSQESFGTSCSSSNGSLPTCTPQEIGPITFPSIGVEEAW